MPGRRRLHSFHRMTLADRRAHAVQVAGTVLAFGAAGLPVTLHLRRGKHTPASPGSRDYRISGASPIVQAARAPTVTLVEHSWRSEAKAHFYSTLALSRLKGERAIVYAREVAPYSLHLARAARRFGIPFVFEAHNVKCLIEEEHRGVDGARSWEAREREIYSLASGVIFTAPLIEGFARARFSFDAPTLLAPNAAPGLTEIGGDEHDSAVNSEAALRDIEILYAGQLYQWKGFNLLLEALARLPGRTLTVAGGGAVGGSGAELDLARARELARTLGVAERVRFLGQLPHEETLRLMRRARVGVIPLPAEGSVEARYFTAPLKLFEFQASGTPVVATDLPSIRALVRDGETGFVVAADPGALASGIDRLLTDRELAERIARTALGEARAFTWENRARQILEFFDRSEFWSGRRSVRKS